jgi:carboxymethylenebutenolidase
MIEQTLDITTKDGEMETFICRPERGGPFPAVFLLMDAPGIREELRDMARRLGTVGYYVLLPKQRRKGDSNPRSPPARE